MCDITIQVKCSYCHGIKVVNYGKKPYGAKPRNFYAALRQTVSVPLLKEGFPAEDESLNMCVTLAFGTLK